MTIEDPDYARIYTQARCLAWSYGWCCIAHGSKNRDLDLLLTPWTEHAIRDVDLLIRRIADVTETNLKGEASLKPHGRMAYTLMLPGFKEVRWVDISVTPMPPRIEKEEAKP